MNYYGPRKIESGPNSGRWHYTCRNDDDIWAVGYCAPRRGCSTCAAKHAFPADPDCEECNGKGLVPVDDPCPGHETEAGACAHYKSYLLDKRLQFHEDREKPDTLHRCQAGGCAEMTSGSAQVGAYRLWHLCSTHRTRDVVSDLMGEIGTSFES